MRKLVFVIACYVLLFPAIVHCAGTDRDSVLAVVGIVTDESAELGDFPAFIVSAESVLVVVPSDSKGSLRRELRIVGDKPDVPMWIAHGVSKQSLDTRSNVVIYFSRPGTWVLAAKTDAVEDMRREGLIVSPIQWTPLKRLLEPSFGEVLSRKLLSRKERLPERLAEPQIAEVDTLNVLENLTFLCFDSSSQTYKTRYSCRSETYDEVVPFLTNLLRTYLSDPAWSVDTMHFEISLCPHGKHLVNIIASRPGRRTSASYVICAHYDATAYREADWDWQTDPAPGSDDNGSGVVAVLECARLLANVDLDVGLKFIAFSGEEQGLLGSSYYVNHLSQADSIIGVINFDMLGYAQPSKLIEITYDWKSAWLAALLTSCADSSFSLPLVGKNRTGIYNSDHASFWAQGIPGIMLNDRTEESGVPAYPYYHTTSDTLGNVDIGQVCDVIRLVTDFMSQFATVGEDSLSDIALSPSSIELNWPGRDWGEPLVEGSEVTAKIRATNLGGSMREPVPYSLEIWEGERQSGRLVYDDTLEIFLAKGMSSDLVASWQLAEGFYGDLTLTFVLLPIVEGIESDLGNNETHVEQTVMPEHLVFDKLHVYPNPLTDVRSAKLAFEILYRETDPIAVLEISVFDITGRMIGEGKLKLTNVFKDFEIGYNANIDLSDFIFDGDLAPGIYLLVARARIIGESDRAVEQTLFAVDR